MWLNKNSSLKLPFPSALFVFALLPGFFELQENIVTVTTMHLMWFTDDVFKVIPLLKTMLHKKTLHIIRTFFNPIQDGGEGSSYQFFPLKTFWLLVLTLLPYWCKISRLYLVPVPNYWTWTKTTLQKKWFFWSNPYKTKIMIPSSIEMLELPNFGRMTTSTI